MAIKLKIHERCERCGQIAAQIEGEMVVGWHDCPNRPPGPAPRPYFHHINTVTFVPDNIEK